MKPDKHQRIVEAIKPELVQLRSEIASGRQVTCTEAQLGLRVWLLPEHYFAVWSTGKTVTTAFFDACTHWPLRRPRLIRAGRLEDHGAYTETPGWTERDWPIGRGVVSKAILSDLGLDSNGDKILYVVKDEREEPPSRWQFYRSPKHPDRKTSLKYKDTLYLARYGPAIAHRLYFETDELPFGCITAHVPNGKRFGASNEAKDEVIGVLGAYAELISDIVKENGYGI